MLQSQNVASSSMWRLLMSSSYLLWCWYTHIRRIRDDHLYIIVTPVFPLCMMGHATLPGFLSFLPSFAGGTSLWISMWLFSSLFLLLSFFLLWIPCRRSTCKWPRTSRLRFSPISFRSEVHSPEDFYQWSLAQSRTFWLPDLVAFFIRIFSFPPFLSPYWFLSFVGMGDIGLPLFVDLWV